MRILVATDGSEAANRSVDFAAALASERKCDLRIVHVIGLGEWTFDEFRHYASEEHVSLADTLNAFSEELLKTARERAEAMGARSVEVETLTETRGYGISGSILDAVHAWKADMVVMGRRGRGLISGLLIGSVSQRVSSMADRPVVLVP